LLFSNFKIGLRFHRNHIIFGNDCSEYYTAIVIYKRHWTRDFQILDTNIPRIILKKSNYTLLFI